MKYYKIIDSDEYINPQQMICYTDEDFERKFNLKQYDVNQGRILGGCSNKITFYYDKIKGDIPTDYLSNDLGWIIVSYKFKIILENIGVNNVQYIPIEIREKSTHELIEGYSIINIIGITDGLNLEQSKYKVFKVKNMERISIIRPVLDNIKLNGLHLVRVKNYLFVTLISEVLKKSLENNNITGCRFQEVEVI
ncbi:hypothetical protein IAI10_06155 [Clostridium sp. 19966]|uniref:imm11 family protein n=1 Tax=Clostridium sp. 19966 TaxID=2768166 RepID=UPI0028DF1519|nr:DUF1629 domain-containing protein [Clostridium sp. 19966]MDT8716233.1 hypothetical protein [Clostridium sp. 19966]